MNVATVGMFDGVHLGHRAILEALGARAKAAGGRAEVLTFSHHPLATLRPEATPKRIVTNARRRRLLEQAGADAVREIDFGDIRRLTAAEFLRKLQGEGFGELVMGFNNHIGSDRLTSGQANALGIIPVVTVPCLEHPEGVSSSAIREALSRGDVAAAARMLGRPYEVEGRVVPGKHLGRTIGFPTANIADVGTMLPADGVYAVDVSVGDMPARRGMANIGTRPTFNDGSHRTLEVNIFDFNDIIYGMEADIAFLARLRDERRFGSADELRRALEADREAALNIDA